MFDRYVADKRKRRPLLYIAFVGSTILEAALIIFFIIYAILHVEEVQPPLLTVTFINAAAPPPPPPPPPKGSTKPKTPKKPTVQPTEVPKQLVQPKVEEPEEKPGEEDGVEGGVEGGVAGGVLGGAVGSPAPPPPPQKPVNKPAFLIKKDKLSGDLPRLPDVIKAQRRGSTVLGTYKICIDASGHVTTVTPVSSIPGADEPIIATLRTWAFKPQPIPVCFIDAFQFIIE
jgi:periplasmic protein TonB